MSRQGSRQSRHQSDKPETQNTPQLQMRPFAPTESPQTSEPQTADLQRQTEAAPASQPDFSFGQVNLFSPGETLSPTSIASPVQAKLTIGQPDDQYEQEADQVAAQVVQQINSPQTAQREDDIQRSPLINRSVMRLPLQRQSSIPVGPASDEFESSLKSARSGGSALQPKVQTQMESAMGADFSGVKIHTDAQANQLSQSIQAKAFTTGNDVFFKQGEYNPGSRSGQALLAHELTHVVQQGAAVQRKPNKIANPLIQRTLRGATHVAGENDEVDMDAVKDETSGVVDTAAAYLGTGGAGPNGDPFPGSAPNSEGAQMGGGGIGNAEAANATGGILGTAVNLYSGVKSAQQLKESVSDYQAKGAEIQDLKGKGNPELYAAITLLEKEQRQAARSGAESSVSLFAAINGVCNGITTAINAIAGLSEGLSVALANLTFGIGAGLNALMGTINAIRDINTARKRSKKQDATQQLVGFCQKLSDQLGVEVAQKQQRTQALEQRINTFTSMVAENLANPKISSEDRIRIGAYHDSEIKASKQEIEQLGAEIPAVEAKITTMGQMMSGLSVSARKQGWKEKGVVSGGLNLMGAAGGAALLAATIGGVAAAATPIGWALSGVAAVSILIYTTSKYVKRNIRNSNVVRMRQEKALIEQSIAQGTKSNQDLWNRSEFPTEEKKGTFNKFLNKIAPWKKKSKSGQTSIGERLNHIDAYLAKYDIEAAGNHVYEGILAALTQGQGAEKVPVSDTETKDFKTAVEELMTTLGINPADLIASMNSEDESVQAQAKQLVLTKMKLLPQGGGDSSNADNTENQTEVDSDT
ncbi:MAG: DUF4157 domain-containing protein [Cyanobacteria bacterium P01_D01_bin.44]